MMKVSRIGSWPIATLLVVTIVGCGRGDLGTVTGKITLDGQPLPDAMVVFTPMTGGRPAAGRTDASGNYEVVHDRNSKGALMGEHVVGISTADELANDDDSVTVVAEKVPSKYNADSELRATIEAGENVFNFDLESGGEIVDANELEASAEGTDPDASDC